MPLKLSTTIGKIQNIPNISQKFYLKKIFFQRIDKMGYDLILMWINHDNEQDPNKKVVILREIFPFQHYLSAYYETVNDIICLSGSDFSKNAVLLQCPLQHTRTSGLNSHSYDNCSAH